MVHRFYGVFTMLKIVLLILLGTSSSPLLAQMASTGNVAPKNLILIIGDGMGPQQIGLLEAYARQAPRSVIEDRTTAFSRLLAEGGVLGMSMTHAANVLNTDSASSATQLAIGKPSGPEMIGIDIDGNPDPTILEIAKNRGKSTGLVSDVRLTHATPASFAAHRPQRTMENEIAVDMLAAGVDVMLSGGLRHWIPQQLLPAPGVLSGGVSSGISGGVSGKCSRSSPWPWENPTSQASASRLRSDALTRTRSITRSTETPFFSLRLPAGRASHVESSTMSPPIRARVKPSAIRASASSPKCSTLSSMAACLEPGR